MMERSPAMAVLLAVLLTPVLVVPARAQDLAGVWDARLDFGPRVSGAIHVLGPPGSRYVDANGYRAPVQADGNRVRFSLPGDRGEFLGVHTAEGSFEGHWLQPATEGLGQKFASPLTLRPDGTRRLTGSVEPLPDRLSFQFVFRRDGDVLQAFLRNPERNLGRLLRLTRLEQNDDALTLHGRWGGGRDEQVLATGRYHADSDRITLTLPGFATALNLRRVTDQADSDYYPRGNPPAPWSYQPPPALDDGWATGTLAGAGLSEPILREFMQSIIDARADSLDDIDLHAVLVARGGRLVLEEYFHGYHRDRAHDTRSASKSLTTVLLGAAMQAGVDIDLETPAFPGAEGAKGEITVGHLATMSSGLACDDWSEESPGGEDRMQNQREQPDWYAYVAAYCSGGMSYVGKVLADRSGRPLARLFHQLIAAPLGLGAYYLNLAPNDHPYMGGGIRWRPRDFLKLGQLLLDDGVWGGRRILDARLAAELVRPRFQLGSEARYALGWWVRTYEHEGRALTAFFAGGNGGQILLGFPELDLVVLFLGGNYSTSATFTAQREYVPRYIVPAALDAVGAAD